MSSTPSVWWCKIILGTHGNFPCQKSRWKNVPWEHNTGPISVLPSGKLSHNEPERATFFHGKTHELSIVTFKFANSNELPDNYGKYWTITMFNGKTHYELPFSIAILTASQARVPRNLGIRRRTLEQVGASASWRPMFDYPLW